MIGGRGPMVVQTKDVKVNDVLVFDPSGVYLDQAELDVRSLAHPLAPSPSTSRRRRHP